MNLVLIRGLKRSGNHLLVNWLRGFYSNSFFWNNCCPRDFTSKEAIIRAILQQSADAVLFSFEIPQYFTETEISEILFACKQEYRKTLSPFIMRDPFNWMASMLYKKSDLPTEKEIACCYRENASQYWGFWLQSLDIWEKTPFPVNFNQFVTEKTYRIHLAERMGIDFDSFSDDGVLNTLWSHIDVDKPSSFDSLAVESGILRPCDMKVFERHQQIAHLFEKYGIPKRVIQRARLHWEIPRGCDTNKS